MAAAPSSQSLRVQEGSCACGAVTWQTTQHADSLDACYCRQCQQISGAPVVYWMGVPGSVLTFYNASASLDTLRLSDMATRGLCSKCGGTLFMKYTAYPETTYLAAATTTRNDFGMPKLRAHIFVRSKPDWFAMPEDGVRRWDDWEDRWAAQRPETVAQWQKTETTTS